LFRGFGKGSNGVTDAFSPLNPFVVMIVLQDDPPAVYGCIATTGGSKSASYVVMPK
jgi:hypothetical protein